MFPPIAVAEEILRVAADALRSGDRTLIALIDELPVAVYAIDLDGYLTYFNPHCAVFAGRQPVLGRDRWCVSWKLYSETGVFIPHDECPMALAVRSHLVVRGTKAVAERPNGSRANFLRFRPRSIARTAHRSVPSICWSISASAIRRYPRKLEP